MSSYIDVGDICTRSSIEIGRPLHRPLVLSQIQEPKHLSLGKSPASWGEGGGGGGHQGNSFKATAAPALCGGIIRCLSLTPEDSKNTEGTLPLGQRVVFGRVYVIRRERQPPNLWRAPQL